MARRRQQLSGRGRLLGAVLCALAAVTIDSRAWAQGAADVASPVVAPAYTLDVDSDDVDVVSYETLAARASAELDAPVARTGTSAATRAAIVVRYRASEKHVTVRATHEGGRVLERSVAVEGTPADIQREIVLLAGNVARDEARELLDALAARPPKVMPPPSPTAEQPAPAPAPEEKQRLATVGFLYPLATNYDAPNARTLVDFSLVYSHVGRVDAFQGSSGIAHASRDLHGAQLSVAASITEGRVYGSQVSAGANIALGGLRGAQVTAGVNVVRGDIAGVQGSSGVNVARDVTGVQASFVNIARKVEGVQVGLVNIAEESDVSVGIVNITKSGIHPLVWTSTLAYTNAGFKLASRYAYSSFSFFYGAHEDDFDSFGLTAAVGAHIPLPSKLDVEIEFAISDVNRRGTSFGNDGQLFVHQRAILGWSFAPRLRVFAGGGSRQGVGDAASQKTLPEVMAGVQF